MTTGKSIIAACCAGLFASPPAVAGAVSHGYACSAAAFTTIGGLDGVGEGSVSMSLDEKYNALSTTVTYIVRDRVTGLGQFEASWPITGDVPFEVPSGPGYVRILFRAGVPEDFVLAVSLDGAPAGTHRFRRAGQYVSDLDAIGFASRKRLTQAAVSERDHPWIPDLRGHNTVSYDIRFPGAPAIGQTYLLPDWHAVRKQVTSALATVEKLRRKHRCDSTVSIRQADLSG